MEKNITLESLYELLSGFVIKQEAFNAKQEEHNLKTDTNFLSLREEFAEFRREEKANHNLSHRMIMQAFESINDVRTEILDDRDEPWKPKKK